MSAWMRGTDRLPSKGFAVVWTLATLATGSLFFSERMAPDAVFGAMFGAVGIAIPGRDAA